MQALDTKIPRSMRPARVVGKGTAAHPEKVQSGNARHRVALVDLNNFATFPTLAIGLLVASLRQVGHRVEVISPLAHDVPGAMRERRETIKDHWRRRLGLSTWRPFHSVQELLRAGIRWRESRPHPVVLREVSRVLDSTPDVLLLSAYLQHHASVAAIGKMAEERGVPVLLGGPMFNVRGVADTWRSMPGITAVFGGEADLTLPSLIEDVVAKRDLLGHAGVTLPDGRTTGAAPPFRPLDASPLPDFTDFPWDRYPNRIIPVMSGRGCQWNRCVFCSDVVSANGRTFRTRSVESILTEMREQSRRHASNKFLFLDLKLNSNPNMIRGIANGLQSFVPGAEWVGTVHVDGRKDNGLSRADLKAAVASGMRRVSFGLESGSQRLLDAMDKGSTVEGNSRFIHDAFEAGLSIRCTMFCGFPGETKDDLHETAEFLEQHERQLDRVRLNGFAIIEDTPIYDALAARAEAFPDMTMRRWDRREGRAFGHLAHGGHAGYRAAKKRVLDVVHRINRKEIKRVARAFDGLM